MHDIRRLGLQVFAAPNNLTGEAQIQVKAREIDFVTSFGKNLQALLDILGITRMIRKENGSELKTNCWKYKDAAAATAVTYGMDVKNWSKWDGESEITSTAGHHITLVECDQNYKAVRSGDVTVTVNPGA